MYRHTSTGPFNATGLRVIFGCIAGVMLVAGAVFADDRCQPGWDVSIGDPGMNDWVRALTVFEGDLIAGGSFTAAGGQEVNHIARWDGTQWLPLASGVDGPVRALAVFDDGSGPALYVGGRFNNAGTIEARNIARWDGSQWSALPGSENGANAPVRAMKVYNGELIVGGQFTSAGGIDASRIVRFDGAQWSPLGTGVSHWVLAMTEYNGDLIVGGQFWNAGAVVVRHVARWNGSQWFALNMGVAHYVHSLAVFDDGMFGGTNLYVGGWFVEGGGSPGSAPTYNRIVRWDGSAWSQVLSPGTVGVAAGSVRAMTVFDGDFGEGTTHPPSLYAGGFFTGAGSVKMNHVGRWQPPETGGIGTWSPLTSDGTSQTNGTDHWIEALHVHTPPGGGPSLYVAGGFTSAGGDPAGRIARFGCPLSKDSQRPECPADLTGSGSVNVFDLLELLSAWGPCSDCAACPADLTGGCSVNVFDLLELLSQWGPCLS